MVVLKSRFRIFARRRRIHPRLSTSPHNRWRSRTNPSSSRSCSSISATWSTTHLCERLSALGQRRSDFGRSNFLPDDVKQKIYADNGRQTVPSLRVVVRYLVGRADEISPGSRKICALPVARSASSTWTRVFRRSQSLSTSGRAAVGGKLWACSPRIHRAASTRKPQGDSHVHLARLEFNIAPASHGAIRNACVSAATM